MIRDIVVALLIWSVLWKGLCVAGSAVMKTFRHQPAAGPEREDAELLEEEPPSTAARPAGWR